MQGAAAENFNFSLWFSELAEIAVRVSFDGRQLPVEIMEGKQKIGQCGIYSLISLFEIFQNMLGENF